VGSSTGGSAGHGCLLGLDIEEGPYDPITRQPRIWRVNVLNPSEIIRSAEFRREQAKDQKATIIANTRRDRDMCNLHGLLLRIGPAGDTLIGLTDQAGFSRERGKAAIDELVERGHVVTCEVVRGKNKRKLDGFRLSKFVDHK
jgi:hypothetical protein